jgi:hypothetical protein
MNDKLKKLIFNKLYNDLSHVEIIHFNDSIWFIDRKTKYWYFEFLKPGFLWWRYNFFKNYFDLFSLNIEEYEPLLTEWVEEVLNYKVNTTYQIDSSNQYQVEEVLNYKVNTTNAITFPKRTNVEEVLNYKVNTTNHRSWKAELTVEEVLNCKVNITTPDAASYLNRVEEALNCKVNITKPLKSELLIDVEEVLNHQTNTTN